MSARHLDPTVRRALEAAEIGGNLLRIPVQLDGATYVAVNKVLTALGGRWDKQQRAHVFPSSPAAALAGVLGSDQAPLRQGQAEGSVATPPELADEIVRGYAFVHDLPRHARVLEPSAGDGALVQAIRRANADVQIVAVEPNVDRAERIPADSRTCVEPVTLEAYAAAREARRLELFDAVVMNPPFTLPNSPAAWIDHIELAWTLLKPGCRLTSVAPLSFVFRQDRRHQRIRDLVAAVGGSHSQLPADAFAASGIGVRTVVLWMEKHAAAAALPALAQAFGQLSLAL